MLRSLILAGYVCVCSARFSSLKMRISAFYLNWNLASLISPSAMRNVNVCLSRSGNVWTSAPPPPYPHSPGILTLRTGRFICFVPRHQVIAAAGFDPELLHSISYVLSAETNARFAKMWTAAGFTGFRKMKNKMEKSEKPKIRNSNNNQPSNGLIVF